MNSQQSFQMSRVLLWSSLLITLVFAFCLHPSEAQFPTVCMPNATLVDAVCCPTPEGSLLACGGGHRGKCKKVSKIVDIKAKWNATRFDLVPVSVMQDDRINWPTRFFTYACDCSFNYEGMACERCAPGWTGSLCLKRTPLRIRKNVLNLTLDEQHLLRDVINASKSTPSNYSVMSIADGHSADPVTKEKLRVYNVSVYDFMVYQHFYATRSTMFDHEMQVCSSTAENALNFAYGGPAFLPWHRYHLLQFEEALARIAETQFNATNFSLSYWDWTGKNSCEICTNDLMGGFSNPSVNVTMDPAEVDDIIRYDDATGIDSLSPFSQWRPLCSDKPVDPKGCHTCDLESREFDETPGLWQESYLQRKYSADAEFQRLPSQEEVDITWSAEELDSLPYNAASPNTSFRNCIEGFATLGGRAGPNNMNNLVRGFLNGSWNDLSSSPNDPIYLFHYAFVDKIFNLFIRSKNQTDRKMPYNKTQYGHSGFEPIVPSFPPVRLNSYILDSKLLGYEYDDDLVGSTVVPPARPKKTVTVANLIPAVGSSSGMVAAAVAALLCITMLATVAVGAYRWRSRDRTFQYVPMDEEMTGQSSPSKFPSERRKKSASQLASDISKSEKIPLLSIR
jgi:hypothetical protein